MNKTKTNIDPFIKYDKQALNVFSHKAFLATNLWTINLVKIVNIIKENNEVRVDTEDIYETNLTNEETVKHKLYKILVINPHLITREIKIDEKGLVLTPKINGKFNYQQSFFLPIDIIPSLPKDDTDPSDIILNGDTKVYGNVIIEGNLEVRGDTKITGNLEVGQDTNIKGDTILNGELTVDGDSTFKSDATFKQNIDYKTISVSGQDGVDTTIVDTGMGATGRSWTVTKGIITGG